MLPRSCIYALSIFLLLVAPHSGVNSQASTGNVVGTAVNEEGEALPGVTVELGCYCEDCEEPEACKCCPDERSFSMVLVSDAEGRVRFPEIPPGTYSLLATLEGFEATEKPEITVYAAQTITRTVMMSGNHAGSDEVD